MKTGACIVQQTFTEEAVLALRQSHGLSKRRGHLQVTPLHVAATLLTTSFHEEVETNTHFRKACLRTHPLHPNPHPLHFRALDLCFSVALNRLPSIPPCSGSLPYPNPSFSNALIAALKRAQAHLRRGNVDQKQQEFLGSLVGLDRLIISILDDPTVSRVMREAGFSSTSVKKSLEREHSISASSMTCSTEKSEKKSPEFSLHQQDLGLIIDVLLGKKKRSNAVVVGDSVSYNERLVEELMQRIGKGDVPEELKSAQFIHFQFSAEHLKNIFRSEVHKKFSDLRKILSSLEAKGKGVVIILLGDLNWTADEETRDKYKEVDHVIAEIGKLQFEWSSNFKIKLLLLATANYQTYMRFQRRRPSLEVQWSLQTVLVPSGGLALSLQTSSDQHGSPWRTLLKLKSKPLDSCNGRDNIILCSECRYNFEQEMSTSNLSALPMSFQPYKQHNQEDLITESRRKWMELCRNLHQNRKNQFQSCLQLDGFSATVFSKDQKRECNSDLWMNSKRPREE